jgi:hypothetical protein
MLLADADAVYAQAHLAMVARATFDVERTGLSSRAIRVKGISVRLLIVSVARKLPARTHTNNLPTALGAFAARRTIGIKGACHGLHAGKRQCQSSKPIFRADFLHGDYQQLPRIARFRSSNSFIRKMLVPRSAARAKAVRPLLWLMNSRRLIWYPLGVS